MRLLVQFRPVEPYSFGTDQGFAYGSEPRTGKESYFVTSRRMPSQTTILGTLRYLLLAEEGLLSTTFNYDRETRRRMGELIGPRSFSFSPRPEELGPDGCQPFGAIKAVSPLFIMGSGTGSTQDVLVPNPFNNKAKINNKAKVGESYRSLALDQPVTCSEGRIPLPAAGEYDPKVGHGKGLIDVRSRKVVEDPFASVFVPGVSKDRRDGDADSFFMRELVTLKKGLSFAVTAEVDDAVGSRLAGEGRGRLVSMGKKASTFEVTVTATDFDLVQAVQDSFSACGGGTWTVALSDLWMTGDWKPQGFFIVEEHGQRSLTTNYDAKNPMGRLRKQETRSHLVEAGSVFAGKPTLDLDKNAQKIGYNSTAILGANSR